MAIQKPDWERILEGVNKTNAYLTRKMLVRQVFLHYPARYYNKGKCVKQATKSECNERADR